MDKSNTHGGARPGAGRKRGEPTKVIRVPESRLHAVKRYLQQAKVAQDNVQHPTIRLPDETATVLPLPLFASRVAAGFASPADDYIETPLDLNQYLIQHPAATFFLRVEGDSMLGAGIHDGDLLVVDRSLEAKDGKVVIAALNGELTVKRLQMREAGGISLLPENPDYPEIKVTAETDLVIWGVVSNVIHPL